MAPTQDTSTRRSSPESRLDVDLMASFFQKPEPNHPSKREIEIYREGTLLGIKVGAGVLIGGFLLCILGLTGSIEWILEGTTLKSRLTNGTPGALFAIVGLIIMWKYKPSVTYSQTRTTEKTTERHRAPDGGYTLRSIEKEDHRNEGGARMGGR